MFIDFSREAAIYYRFVRADDEHQGPVRMNVYDLWKRGYFVTEEHVTDEQWAYIQARKADEARPRARRL